MPMHATRHGNQRSATPERNKALRQYYRRLRVAAQKAAEKSSLLRIPTVTGENPPGPRTEEEKVGYQNWYQNWYQNGLNDGRNYWRNEPPNHDENFARAYQEGYRVGMEDRKKPK